MNDVNTIIDMLLALPEKQRVEVMSLASDATKSQIWIPNPGPQTEAYFSEADELFYGGSAGGGKSDAGIGLALTQHSTSLLLRRTNKEALGLATRIEEIVGSRDGYNGSTGTWRFPDRVIDIGGCQLEDDKQKYKGNPHSLIFFDEVSDFSESQYTFINTWNRSTKPGERCRIVAAGNPPTRPEGLWVMKRWSAWLDQSHQRPAKPGEVRWYLRPDDGDEIEVDGKGPYEIDGRSMEARSRTFIPALLGDNPDLSATDYAAMLDSLPKELRDAYRDGKFNTMLADGAFQTIPSEWVMLAMDRWTDKPPEGVPMCAIGLDMAQGGTDLIVAAPRYDAWFAPLIKASGREVTTGAKAAGFVMSLRRDNALIIIDMGGGYGGACYEWLHDNDVPIKAYKGAEASTRRTLDRQLSFYNKRSEAYWLLREALDPGQPGGSQIALPFDRELIADLCAPTFTVGPRGIQVEPKESVCKRLKRSTDCFVAGTLVMTPFGERPIESLRIGDKVITPYGNRKIIATHTVDCDDIKEFWYKGNLLLRGKQGHKVFTWNKGAIDFTLAGDADIMEWYSTTRILLWRVLTLFYTKKRNIGFKAQVNITLVENLKGLKTFCTDGCGQTFLEKYQKDSMFIMLMEIGQIMIFSILNSLKVLSIYVITWLNDLKTAIGCKSKKSGSNLDKTVPRCGTLQKKVKLGIVNMENERGTTESLFQKYVRIVKQSLLPDKNADFVLLNVFNKHGRKTSKLLIKLVLFVQKNLKQTNTNLPYVVQERVETNLLQKIEKVYDITLDKDNVYYANRVLVFNCGDAVVMSWSGGNKLENMVKGQWPVKGRNFKPKVITSGRVNPRR